MVCLAHRLQCKTPNINFQVTGKTNISLALDSDNHLTVGVCCKFN